MAMQKAAPAAPLSAPARCADGDGRVRIIGGHWRRRILRFDSRSEVRPTPDRVRETLFNWLQPQLQGCTCLDLFAGSGALALEALSRGASRVVAVDNNRRTVRALEQNRALLQATGLEVVYADARDFLANDARCFAIVFLDPPYRDAALRAALHTTLRESRCCGPQTLVYMESPADAAPPTTTGGWRMHRERLHGGVRFGLYHPSAPLQAATTGLPT